MSRLLTEEALSFVLSTAYTMTPEDINELERIRSSIEAEDVLLEPGVRHKFSMFETQYVNQELVTRLKARESEILKKYHEQEAV